ncbi:MAG: PilZ domain-containing protein [Candidatus Scalinduaceae bacterium]
MKSTINISRKKTVASHLRGNERRTEKRTELSLPMTIFDCKAKTKNISPNGVYFEVITKDVENYPLGKEIMVYIEGIYSKSVLTERRVWVNGSGVIVRIDDKGFFNHNKKLGVALKFSKEPNIFF